MNTLVVLNFSGIQRCFRLLLVGGALLAGLGACARAPYQYQPPITPPTAPSRAATPQLLFLSFRMQAAPRTLALVSAKVVPGQATGMGEGEIGAAYLTITQLDKSQQPCAAPVRVPHPLLRDMEYPGEASGTLERRMVALSEADFFVRMVRQPAAVAVRIAEVAPTVASPLSLTLPLDFTHP